MKELKFIADYFGTEIQKKKLIEELHELSVELIKDPSNNLNLSTVSEIADVFILITQLLYLTDSHEEFEEEKEYKIKRTINRILNNYYQ